jgi:hypothetical protein
MSVPKGYFQVIAAMHAVDRRAPPPSLIRAGDGLATASGAPSEAHEPAK